MERMQSKSRTYTCNFTLFDQLSRPEDHELIKSLLVRPLPGCIPRDQALVNLVSRSAVRFCRSAVPQCFLDLAEFVKTSCVFSFVGGRRRVNLRCLRYHSTVKSVCACSRSRGRIPTEPPHVLLFGEDARRPYNIHRQYDGDFLRTRV